MIIDTSALLAILYQENDTQFFTDAISQEPRCQMSTANHLEAAINIDSAGDAEASRQLDAFIGHAGITIEQVTIAQVQIARQAYQDFGKGRHPAKLNYGDCFAYALARVTDAPCYLKEMILVRLIFKCGKRHNLISV